MVQPKPKLAKQRQVTILFLIENTRILLAIKKRGFGVGKWNGVGGKVEAGETVEESVKRECIEEIGVIPIKIEKVAVINFYFEKSKKSLAFDQQAHVFLCRKWQGKPVETEEMRPKWFKLTNIPYKQMWSDDIYWLPAVLIGEKLEATVTFDKQEVMNSFTSRKLM